MNRGALWTGIILILYIASAAPVEAWHITHPESPLLKNAVYVYGLFPSATLRPGAAEMPGWVRTVYAPAFWLARRPVFEPLYMDFLFWCIAQQR